MRTHIILFIILFYGLSVEAQDINRVEIDGQIFSDTNDVENVTVYNTSTNIGTITDANGSFKIDVALNDVLEISALQFKPIRVTIDVETINSKQIFIQLIESVNQLEEIMLSYGLTGNLKTDISEIKKIEMIKLDLANLSFNFQYYDDKAFDNNVISHELNKLVNKGGLYNGVNFAQLLGVNSLFKIKSNKQNNIILKQLELKEIVDVYSHEYLSQVLGLPIEKIEAFIVFVEDKGFKQEYLNPENELEFIEFLLKQKSEFLKQ